MYFFYFVKQNTEYEMRISDWSSDVCSSDLVDAARAIVDGHIILSRSLAEQGVYPAIDIGRSLSRVMADIISPEHAGAAAALRRIWSAYEENRDLILMGAYAAGGDPMIDEAIARRPDLRSEEHTSEIQSLKPISYAVFCLKKTTYTTK